MARTTVQTEKLPEIDNVLEKLGAQTPTKISLDIVLGERRELIAQLHDRGFEYSEIVSALSGVIPSLTEAKLRYYLTDRKKKTNTRDSSRGEKKRVTG